MRRRPATHGLGGQITTRRRGRRRSPGRNHRDHRRALEPRVARPRSSAARRQAPGNLGGPTRHLSPGAPPPAAGHGPRTRPSRGGIDQDGARARGQLPARSRAPGVVATKASLPPAPANDEADRMAGVRHAPLGACPLAPPMPRRSANADAPYLAYSLGECSRRHRAPSARARTLHRLLATCALLGRRTSRVEVAIRARRRSIANRSAAPEPRRLRLSH
jgi:hypothetical protein